MAFTTQRGRPRKLVQKIDYGTPELRLKHAMRLTVEPIDLCLEKGHITKDQHWCGLHLRWLYTLRYGAPNLTTYYSDRESLISVRDEEDPEWKTLREREYHSAVTRLREYRRYEPVMRLAIHNERPAFLDPHVCAMTPQRPALAEQLERGRHNLREGLELLTELWRRPR